jgi:hypothetical protein
MVLEKQILLQEKKKRMDEEEEWEEQRNASNRSQGFLDPEDDSEDLLTIEK